MASTIQIRVDDDLKTKAEELFMTEDEILDKLEHARMSASEGRVKEASDISRNLRDKYDL